MTDDETVKRYFKALREEDPSSRYVDELEQYIRDLNREREKYQTLRSIYWVTAGLGIAGLFALWAWGSL